jgi:WD40 repeat protein
MIPLQSEIWNEAYDGLREDEQVIVEAYERILSGQIETGAASAIGVEGYHENAIETASRQDQLKKLLEDGQARTEKMSKIKGKIKGVVEPFDKLRAIISLAVNTEPAAATAWTGITAVLDVSAPLIPSSYTLISSLKQPANQSKILASPLSEPGANREGIKYILERAEWYWQLSSLLFDPNIDKSLQGLQSSLRGSIVRLYQKLLLYQMKSVCLYGRCEAAVIVRDLFKLDDWKAQITAIENEAERVRKDVAQFGTFHLGSRLETIDQSLQEVRTDLQAITAAIQEFGNEERERNEHDKDTNFIKELSAIQPESVKQDIVISKGGFMKEAYDLVLQQSNFAALQSDANTRVIWITGNPGKGKTMFLCGVIDEIFERQKLRMIAYFFCRADNQNTNTANSVIRGLLYHICDQSPGIARRLRKRFEKQPENLIQDDSGPASRELEKMLSEVLDQPSMRRAVLVVDAIDECSIDSIGTLFGIIGRLSRKNHTQWIVSTRTSNTYRSFLADADFDVNPAYLELNDSVDSAAIQAFIEYKVDRLAKDNKYDGHIKRRVLETLSEKAGDTFLWVALVCLELKTLGNATRHIDTTLLDMPQELNGLYERMLEKSYASRDGQFCRQILPLVCIARRPLALDELHTLVAEMQGLSDTETRDIVANCGSFLTLQRTGAGSETLTFIHESAREYLKETAQIVVFPNGIHEQHRSVLKQSLTVIKLLPRDIYNLGRPGVSINEIEIPQPDPLSCFRYSCLHWLEHAAHVLEHHCWGDPEDAYIRSFIQEDLLHWLEALSLMKSLPQATAGFQKVNMFFRTSTRPVSRDLNNLVEEARRFILYNKACIEMAPLQVYASAILFWPRDGTGKIKDCYQSGLDLVTMQPESTKLSSSQHVQELPCGRAWRIAYSTDGRHVALVTLPDQIDHNFDQRIEIWDVYASHQLRSSALNEPVIAITSSHDGKSFISLHASGTIQGLDIDSGKWFDNFNCGFSNICEALFSAKCQFLALQLRNGHRYRLVIMNLATKRKIQSIRDRRYPRFSPDETQMITLQGRHVTLWTIGNDSPIRTISFDTQVRDVAFFGDERVAAIAFPHQPSISVRTTKDGSEILALPLDKEFYSITWLGNGLSYMGVCASGIAIHDDTGRNCVRRLSTPSSALMSEKMVYSFCHTTESVAWCGYSAVHIWDINIPTNDSGGEDTFVDGLDPIIGVYLSPGTSNEVVLAAPHYHRLTVRSRRDEKILGLISDEGCRVQQIFFSPTGRHIIVRDIDGTKRWLGKIFDTEHGMIGGCLGDIHRQSECADFSADGDSIAFALGIKGIQIWGLAKQDVRASISRPATTVKFSHDSQLLAITNQGHIEIWSLLSPAQHLGTIDLHDSSSASVAFSPDDKSLVIANSGHIYVWHFCSSEPSRELLWSYRGEPFTYISLALSSDGNFAAVAVDCRVWIWNLNQPASAPQYQELPHATRTCSFAINATHLLVDGGAVVVSSISGVCEDDRLSSMQGSVKYEGYALSKDLKWITRNGQNLLYLPAEYRLRHWSWEKVSFQGSMVAFATTGGHLYLLRF